MSVPAIAAVPTAVTGFVGAAQQGPVDTPVPVESAAAFAATFGSSLTPLSLAVSQFFENGGERALIVGVGSSPSADDNLSEPKLEAEARGLWALDKAGRFSLLCVPAFGFGAGAEVSARTRRAAVELCRRRRAVFLADPLSAWTNADAVLTGPESLDSVAWGLPRESHAAVYVPPLVVANVAGGPALACGPCGAIAGVIARTDRQRGVWKAPAGRDALLRGATALSASMGEVERERLDLAGVNVLRVVPDAGLVIWGARTLLGDDASASEWKYLPVRRLSLFIEESIDEGTQWAAVEPNGEAMWAELRRLVSTFLHELFRAGAFQGGTPREAYFVKCDAQTTTAADIEAGQTKVVVGFAPLKPAEFVVLEVMVKTAGPDEE